MKRYGWSIDDEFGSDERLTIEVVERDDGPEWSGLYDAHGRKLYRPRPTVRMGFDLTPRRRRSNRTKR